MDPKMHNEGTRKPLHEGIIDDPVAGYSNVGIREGAMKDPEAQ